MAPSVKKVVSQYLKAKEATLRDPERAPGYFDVLSDFPGLYKVLGGKIDDMIIDMAEFILQNGDPYAVLRGGGRQPYHVPTGLREEFDSLVASIEELV